MGTNDEDTISNKAEETVGKPEEESESSAEDSVEEVKPEEKVEAKAEPEDSVGEDTKEKVEEVPEKAEEVLEKVKEVPEKVKEVPEKVKEVPEKVKEVVKPAVKHVPVKPEEKKVEEAATSPSPREAPVVDASPGISSVKARILQLQQNLDSKDIETKVAAPINLGVSL
jgi:molecular chaperone DnaK (HSP70)